MNPNQKNHENNIALIERALEAAQAKGVFKMRETAAILAAVEDVKKVIKCHNDCHPDNVVVPASEHLNQSQN